VVQIGTPEELFNKPQHTFVGYFIGSPGMNVLSAAVTGSVATVHDRAVPLGESFPTLDGKVEIGVRPEFITLTEGEGLPVTIRRVEDVGRHKIIRADLFGQEISIVAGEDQPISPDMNSVMFDPQRVNVYVNDWLKEGEVTS
jgi:glycerol transport system ATP-binding protein